MRESVSVEDHLLLQKQEELKLLVQRREELKLENAMLSEHLSRVMTRKGSMRLHLENMEAEELEREDEEADQAVAATAGAAAGASGRRKSRKSFRIFHEAPPKQTVRFAIATPARVADSARRRQSSVKEPLNIQEKLDIVEEEINAHNEHIDRIRVDNDGTLESLRGVIKTAEYAMREVTNQRNFFQRDLLDLAKANVHQRLYIEDFARFQEEQLRKKRKIREKLQEKLDVLHMCCMETNHNLEGKKDLNEVLTAVDFDQYGVMNQRLHIRLDDRSKEIWKVKAAVKTTVQSLGEARSKLQKFVAKGNALKHAISDKEQLVTVSQELIAVEKKQQRKLNGSTLRQLQETDGPPHPTVLDYMRKRIRSVGLRRELKCWVNKVEIIENTHARLKRHVRSVLRHRDAMLDRIELPSRFSTPVMAQA